MNNLYKLLTLVEIIGILGIAGIALKRNNDAYKAECKLLDTEIKLGFTELDGICKDIKIEELEKELKELKKEKEL